MSRATQLRPRMTTGGLLPTPPARFVRSPTMSPMRRSTSAAGRLAQMVGLPKRKRSPMERLKDTAMGALRSVGLTGNGRRSAKRRGSGRSTAMRGKTGGRMAMAAGAAGVALKNRERIVSMFARPDADKRAGRT